MRATRKQTRNFAQLGQAPVEIVMPGWGRNWAESGRLHGQFGQSLDDICGLVWPNTGQIWASSAELGQNSTMSWATSAEVGQIRSGIDFGRLEADLDHIWCNIGRCRFGMNKHKADVDPFWPDFDRVWARNRPELGRSRLRLA